MFLKRSIESEILENKWASQTYSIYKIVKPPLLKSRHLNERHLKSTFLSFRGVAVLISCVFNLLPFVQAFSAVECRKKFIQSNIISDTNLYWKIIYISVAENRMLSVCQNSVKMSFILVPESSWCIYIVNQKFDSTFK